MTEKMALTVGQIEAIARITADHPNGSFELYKDEVAGRRVLIFDVSEYSSDAASQMDGPDLYRHLITSTHNGKDLVTEVVQL